jgi:hypothetical protein
MMTSRKPDDGARLISRLQETPIAVIGMACLLPGARNLREFWSNIVNKKDSITDVPTDRWDVNEYYDPDPKTPDKTYCRRGGFLPEVDFDPMEFGIPPNILEVTEVSQLLSLIVAKQVLEDAGRSGQDRYHPRCLRRPEAFHPFVLPAAIPGLEGGVEEKRDFRAGRGGHCRED